MNPLDLSKRLKMNSLDQLLVIPTDSIWTDSRTFLTSLQLSNVLLEFSRPVACHPYGYHLDLAAQLSQVA